jgi:hypothetical protein
VSRTPASVTQADVARAIRAAKQTGAGTVEVRGSSIFIHLTEIEGKTEKNDELSSEVVL